MYRYVTDSAYSFAHSSAYSFLSLLSIPRSSWLVCVLVLMTVIAGIQAAEVKPEIFTLKDGRTIIGTYDAKTGILSTVGAMKGAVLVKPEDIASRAPVSAEVLEAINKPKPKREITPEEKARQESQAKLEEARGAVRKDKMEMDGNDKKIERDKRKLKDFRLTFKRRAESEGKYYDADRSEETLLIEDDFPLKTGEGNTAIQQIVTEIKKLQEKNTALASKLLDDQAKVDLLEADAGVGPVTPPATKQPKPSATKNTPGNADTPAPATGQTNGIQPP